jgi:hypothetical protein
MKNVTISKARTFNEDSQIRIKGTVEVAEQVVKFELETEEDGTIEIFSFIKLDEAMLVKLLLEVDEDLDCFLF